MYFIASEVEHFFMYLSIIGFLLSIVYIAFAYFSGLIFL